MFCGSELPWFFPPDKQHVLAPDQVVDCQKVKMSRVWLWVTISLPWTVVSQHLGAGGLPGQRTPRTGDPRNTLQHATHRVISFFASFCSERIDLERRSSLNISLDTFSFCLLWCIANSTKQSLSKGKRERKPLNE